MFNEQTGLFWRKRMPDHIYIAKEEKSVPGFKAAEYRLPLFPLFMTAVQDI
jgi:hypothetical protein